MLTFLKLGGSLITDKAGVEAPRLDVIRRVSGEIAEALCSCPDLKLIIGHGSGSFGHVVAKQYGTRGGVNGQEAWRGFARVSVVAARLNQIVLDALDAAGVPVWRIQPSASVVCRDGQIIEMALKPIRRALGEGLVPLVYGDVALDEVRGGTIISTENIFSYLAHALAPERILLAGDMEGVVDRNGQVIAHISPAMLDDALQAALGGSEHTDVTGGMAQKVAEMLMLCRLVPGLRVHIFSGLRPGNIVQALTSDHFTAGTCLSDADLSR